MTNKELLKQYVNVVELLTPHQLQRLSLNLRKSYFKQRLAAYGQGYTPLHDYEVEVMDKETRERYWQLHLRKGYFTLEALKALKPEDLQVYLEAREEEVLNNYYEKYVAKEVPFLTDGMRKRYREKVKRVMNHKDGENLHFFSSEQDMEIVGKDLYVDFVRQQINKMIQSREWEAIDRSLLELIKDEKQLYYKYLDMCVEFSTLTKRITPFIPLYQHLHELPQDLLYKFYNHLINLIESGDMFSLSEEFFEYLPKEMMRRYFKARLKMVVKRQHSRAEHGQPNFRMHIPDFEPYELPFLHDDIRSVWEKSKNTQ